MISINIHNLQGADVISAETHSAVVLRFGSFNRVSIFLDTAEDAVAVAAAINRTITQTPTKRF
ncbi:hypothetical protein LUX29_20545 [Aureimonas altamirensis]|uniref:hypothetical protein n=1 Tax=Aureimonas altamirensis TaxID=370622 RepID=UPI001E5520A6|nr:hypothetical protein [Aureimonas altamirensis]UHD45352.1 hypothetical protein LUX29_20545 [Aureimonas altamirensis]